MKNLFLVFALILINQTSVAALPTIFTDVTCVFENQTGEMHLISKPLMLIYTDRGVARFAQLHFISGVSKMQYQVLIENSENNTDEFLILQNFMVDGVESSVELESLMPTEIETQQGPWSARCNLVH